MSNFDQVEFDSLAPYEQKEYEMKNPRPRAPRGSSAEAGFDRMMKNVSEADTSKIEKNLENYRAKVGSDAGGKTIRSGGGGGGGMGTGKMNRDISKLMKKGGKVKTFRHHDGIAQRGKTRA